MSHDLFLMMWLILTWHDSFSCDMTHCDVRNCRVSISWAMTHSNVTWLIRVRYDVFATSDLFLSNLPCAYVIWLIVWLSYVHKCLWMYAMSHVWLSDVHNIMHVIHSAYEWYAAVTHVTMTCLVRMCHNDLPCAYVIWLIVMRITAYSHENDRRVT